MFAFHILLFQLLASLGAEVRAVAPSTLLPDGLDGYAVQSFTDMDVGLAGADVVMMLRLQTERMEGAYVPSPREYFRFYGLTEARLAKAAPDVLVMHPGPMNRGVEIAVDPSELPGAVITQQVTNGIAVRMAVLFDLLGSGGPHVDLRAEGANA